MSIFEKKETPDQVLLRAALLEAPILVAGVLAYFFTSNWIWPVLAMIAGSAIILPAVFKAQKLQQERDNASR